MTTGRRRLPVARRPSAGVVAAAATIVDVSTHWAVEIDTSNCAAIAGISGAPRLLVTAVTAVTAFNVVISHGRCWLLMDFLVISGAIDS